MPDTQTSEIERLSEEHTALSWQQFEALQESSYAYMSKSEAVAYDDRLIRIVEIRRQLAKHREKGLFLVS